MGITQITGDSVMNTVGNGILSILAIVAALSLGLFLRRLLVQRLRKTVLDNWIIQTLGLLVILLLLIPGTIGAVAIWSQNLLNQFWRDLNIAPATALNFLGNLALTLLLIGLGMGVARTIKNLTILHLGERRIDINIRTLIGRVFYFTVLLIATFWILSLWQVSIGIPVAVIGAVTVALTVSMQDIIKDLVAGFYILVERPFYIGDQISVTTNAITYLGKVEGIELRATKLRLLSGEEVTIPNMLVFGNAVVNNTYYDKRRATINLTMAREDFHKEETPASILNALKSFANISEHVEPTVLFSSYKDEKITLIIRFWIITTQTIDISDIMYGLYTLLPKAELVVREPAESI